MQSSRTNLERGSGLSPTRVRGRSAIQPWLAELERLADATGQPGSMHGINILLDSQFARRKQPELICFHRATQDGSALVLAGAVLLLEYKALGLGTGVFTTGDAFGVRTVVGPPGLHGLLCAGAGRFLLQSGATLVLATWRLRGNSDSPVEPDSLPHTYWYALQTRSIQDTLELGTSAEGTLQAFGKRTRVHLRADRRRFDRLYPEARLQDATAALATASDAELTELNQNALDRIDQAEFNHQVRTVCRSRGGFVLGHCMDGVWISLIGGWRQGADTFIEWQCNRRGFQKLSLGGVLRTYLLEDEAQRGGKRLHFHGGTSHSMGHSFTQTRVADLLMRRQGFRAKLLVTAAPLLCRLWPTLLDRGNFVLNALCTPGLRWRHRPCSPQAGITPAAQLENG